MSPGFERLFLMKKIDERTIIMTGSKRIIFLIITLCCTNFIKLFGNDSIAIDICNQEGGSVTELMLYSNYIFSINPQFFGNEGNSPNFSLMGPINCGATKLFLLNKNIVSKKPHQIEQKDRSNYITFKQFIFDYIYQNSLLAKHPISIINCNIDGSEEGILEDLLHFSYYNHCKLKVAFNYSVWTNSEISQQAYLFPFFTTDCPQEDIVSYIETHPNAVVCFEPKKCDEPLIKKNVTAVIIGYNLVTFIKHMVDQLQPYTSDIVIVDNNSDYEPLLQYYENEYSFTLLKQNKNYGHRVYMRDEIKSIAGQVHILTDPDIYFQESMPPSLIQDMIKISKLYKCNRVGPALCIDRNDINETLFSHQGPDKLKLWSVKEWESQFWKERIPNNEFELYNAWIDTTFCLINNFNNSGSIRIAGPYTALHMPWHIDFEKMLLPTEMEHYRNSISTTWVRD